MVKAYKLHKFVGLTAGLLILILGVTGFFINHDKWSFLYSTTFSYVPDSVKKADKRLFEAYWINPVDFSHSIVGSKRGIFESFDYGQNFKKMTEVQCLAIRENQGKLYAATSDGVYTLENRLWKPYALRGEYITAISVAESMVVAVIEKHELISIDKNTKKIISRDRVSISVEKLQHSISLSRFVRDLHYGRGLFDGDISLIINDYGAIISTWLALSGFFIWFYIRKKKKPRHTKQLIQLHANFIAIVAIIPLLILAITGIFLDHSSGLAKFMRSVTIPHTILPPVYESLKHDIWSVDYDGKKYRIGNRHGIYSSEDLKTWTQEIQGLAYRMIRKDEVLYVSGMGAPNKIYDGTWKTLPETPHMFRDVLVINNEVSYCSPMKISPDKLPDFKEATLYSILLTLHDGTFFAKWWVWINDYAAIALGVLYCTGVIRWYKKKTVILRK